MNSPSNNTAAALRACFFENGTAQFTVAGRSMYPYLKNGQLVVLKAWDKTRPLVPGACYAYVCGQKIMLHRFVSCAGSVATFWADNLDRPEKADIRNIIGRFSRNKISLSARICAFINSFYMRFNLNVPALLLLRRIIIRFVN